MRNPFIDTAQAARNTTKNRQARNRTWWEKKPMTYADWTAKDRALHTKDDILEMEKYVLRTGPWLKTWFNANRFDNMRCLDLGSGSGIFSSLLSRRGADTTAIDLTEAGVEMTRSTARFFGCDVSVVRGDAELLPFADTSFEFVYSWGVLHHTQNMEKALQQMGRVLKPGGLGIIMVYHRSSVVYYLHGLYWLLAKRKLFQGHGLESVQDFYTDGYYHRYLTRQELTNMLDKAGLHVTSVHVTQYEKSILPLIFGWVDKWLKSQFGMCLIAQFERPKS